MHAIPATPTDNTITSRITTTHLAPCWMIVSLDGVERGRFNEISDAGAYGKARRLKDVLAGEVAREEAAAKAAPRRRTWHAPSPELDARMDAGQEAIADPNFFSLCLALESAPF
jgi:hypothetical protein